MRFFQIFSQNWIDWRALVESRIPKIEKKGDFFAEQKYV